MNDTIDKEKSPRVKIPKWLQYLIAAVPIAWIFWHVNLHDLAFALKRVTPWSIPVYTVLVLLSISLQGVRWWALVRAFVPGLGFGRTMSFHFAGLFYSIALPGSAQDVVRALLVSQHADYSVVWGATWLSRIIALCVLAVLSVFGIFVLDSSRLPPGFLLSMVSAFVVLSVLFLASFSKRITSPGRPLLKKILPAGFFGILENIREAVYKYRSKKAAVLGAGLLTLLMWLTLIAATCLAIKGITGKLFISECIAYVPIIELLCIAIPITPNGLGIREALTGVMFLHLGLSTEQLGIYIVFGFYSIMLKIVGVIPVLVGTVGPSRAAKTAGNTLS
jgi:uncharacterized protein (TIRG00374 family)